MFIWVIDGHPDNWSVTIQSSDQENEEIYEMGVIEFLNALLRRDISSKILPSQFPSKGVNFESA